MTATITLRRILLFYALSSHLPNCSSFAPSPSSSSNKVVPRLNKQHHHHHHHHHHHSSHFLHNSHHHHPDRDEQTRVEFLQRSGNLILASVVTPPLLLKSNVANAAAPSTAATATSAAQTPAEAIRLLSSKSIPGLGPPDVYYPPYFVGKWKVTKVIATSDDNFWKDMKDNYGIVLPVKVVSEMRFVPYNAGKDFLDVDVDAGGNNNPNNVPAIADRSYNEKSYHASLAQQLNEQKKATTLLPSIQSLNWTPTNPNVLSLSYVDGSSKEVKVTKRSSDVSKDGMGVFSTEFRRITAVDAPSSDSVAGGIPQVYKSRLLTKWKRGDDNLGVGGGSGSGGDAGGVVNVIEGIEIMYNEQGTFGDKSSDPLLGGSGGTGVISSLYGGDSKDLSDWRSTKTKILMERIG
mmetsp:Transcript_32508/g.59938  ORF Transcript_32508/g.59938 Transcript_32508/m.59938 type:complete len:405 (+) Transcript_32508:46-1260(+)